MPLIELKRGKPIHVVRANHGAHNSARFRFFQKGLHQLHSNAPTTVVGMNKDLIDIQVALTLRLENRALSKFHDSRSVGNYFAQKFTNEEEASIEPGLKMLSRTREISGRAVFITPSRDNSRTECTSP